MAYHKPQYIGNHLFCSDRGTAACAFGAGKFTDILSVLSDGQLLVSLPLQNLLRKYRAAERYNDVVPSAIFCKKNKTNISPTI